MGERLIRFGWGWAAALALALGLSGARAFDMARRTGIAVLAAPEAQGFEAQDHFPGAASFYAASDEAAPAHGTTGTVAPPPEPAAAAPIELGTGTVTPALPFRTARVSALDRGRALECLTAAIYYEAASESDDGERAVAQVVLNRVRHPAFPATVCGVVYQGSEKQSCQFSFACDGSMARARSRAGWARALRFAAEALAGQVFGPVGLATHYHTYAVTPSWNRALVMTDAVGAHFFHRWKGYWGTAAAFHQVYTGHEPEPGPHARLDDPALPVTPLPVVAAVLPTAAAPTATVQPAHVESGAALAPVVASTLPDSPVLDRWKDSGKPLR